MPTWSYTPFTICTPRGLRGTLPRSPGRAIRQIHVYAQGVGS